MNDTPTTTTFKSNGTLFVFETHIAETYNDQSIERVEIHSRHPFEGVMLGLLNEIGEALQAYTRAVVDASTVPAVGISREEVFDQAYKGIRVEMGKEAFFIIADLTFREGQLMNLRELQTQYCLIEWAHTQAAGQNVIVPLAWLQPTHRKLCVQFPDDGVDAMMKTHEAVVFKPGSVDVTQVDDIFGSANLLHSLFDDGWLNDEWSAAFQAESLL